jgi:RNA polymerase sigma factor (sigma-70 family)
LYDRDLLECYLERRDEAAFAALVRRHGGMVLGVCRSVLRDRHEAEDATQATYLVLARHAGSIRRRDGVAAWLHGVAYRVARKAQAATARRRLREVGAAVAEPAASADDLSWGEVRAALHAELSALPPRYREPLVLCYLEGLTLDETARRLGWSANSVKGRLQRGRVMLRRRLDRRGLNLAAALGAVALAARTADAALPPTLIEASVRLALAPAAAASPIALLAENVIGPSVSARLKIAVPLLLLGATLACGVAFVLVKAGQQPPAPAKAKPLNWPALIDRHGDALPPGAVARLGTVRFNHGDGLDALFYTRDRKTIVSKGGGFVRLWDAETGKELSQFATAKPGWDETAVLLPDDQTLVVLSQDDYRDVVRAWNLVHGVKARSDVVLNQRREGSAFQHNALSPDGKLCALHMNKLIRVFDVVGGKEMYTLAGGADEFLAVTFAGSGRLVTAKKSKLIEVWEAGTGKLIRQFDHGARADFLVASPDGRLLVTRNQENRKDDPAEDRGVARLWDLDTGQRRQTFAPPPKGYYIRAAFSPDGRHLITSCLSAEKQEVAVWSVETGERVHDLAGAAWECVAASLDGAHLVAGAERGKFEQWDLKPAARLSKPEGRGVNAAAVLLTPAGDRILTAGPTAMTTWDATTGRLVRSFDLPFGDRYEPLPQLSRGGRVAVTYSGDWRKHPLHIWDVTAGKQRHQIEIPDQSPGFLAALSPDGSLLATAPLVPKDPIIRFWDVRTAKEIRSIPLTDQESIGQLEFGGDGKALFVRGIRVSGYDVATGGELFNWKPAPGTVVPGQIRIGRAGQPLDEANPFEFSAMAVSPDGSLVAGIQADRTSGRPAPERVVLCDARTGKTVRRWGDSGHGRYRERIVFSRDGTLLASAEGTVVHIWDVATGTEIQEYAGHRGWIRDLAFSADHKRLASASYDSTVLIWDLVPPAEGGGSQLEARWADLAGADAAAALVAVWRLAEAPADSVPMLRQHLKPITAAQTQAIRDYVAALDAPTFAARDKARRALLDFGPEAVPALRRALDGQPSAELRRRANELLDQNAGPPRGEPLRTWRALSVLERAGTSDARGLLRTLAGGAPDAWLTTQAAAALDRLAERDKQVER